MRRHHTRPPHVINSSYRASMQDNNCTGVLKHCRFNYLVHEICFPRQETLREILLNAEP